MFDIDTNNNDPALLVLSGLYLLNVDADFLSKLKRSHSSCSYFSNGAYLQWLRIVGPEWTHDCGGIRRIPPPSPRGGRWKLR